MAATPILAITQVAANQNAKEITINDGFMALEAASNAALTVSLASGSATLTPTQFGKHGIFACSGHTAPATLTVPAVQRLFYVFNGSGTNAITVGCASGLTVSVQPLSFMFVWSDGTDCRAPAGIGGAGDVTSVAGHGGAVTLAQLVSSGLMPAANATPTGTLDASAATGVLVPTVAGGDSSTHAASTAFVAAALAGAASSAKPSARLATAAALPANGYAGGILTATANGALTVDGVSISAGDRVLVKNEAASANNGLYLATAAGDASHPYVLTRDLTMSTAGSFAGSYVVVEAGTANTASLWVCDATGSVSVGSTPIGFARAGAGALPTISANTVLANPTGSPAAAAATTVSALLDAALGSARGSVLFRGAAGWSLLAPGTAGQGLLTGGAAADPAWGTVGGAAPNIQALLDGIGAVEGELLYRGPSGWQALAAGTAGQVLVSGGAGAIPAWASLPASLWHEKFVLSVPGTPVAATNYWRVPVQDSVQIGVNMGGSAAVCGTHPATTATVLTVSYLRGGTTTVLGTVTFGTSGTSGTLAGPASPVTLLPGDILIASFGAVDSALSDVGLMMVGLKQ